MFRMEEDTNNITFDNISMPIFSRTTKLDWIIPFTINILLLIITIAVLISLLYYGIKTGKWRVVQTSNYDKLNAGIVYTSLIGCAVSCVFRYIANQANINAGFTKDDDGLCEAAADAAFVAYAMVLFFVSLFLWFRQRAFYTNRMLSFKSSKPIRIVSFGSIILIVGGGFTYIFIFTIPTNFMASPQGCVLNVTSDVLLVTYVVYVNVLIVFAQVLLLCLFVYPLLKLYFNNSLFACLRRVKNSKSFRSKSESSDSSPHISDVSNNLSLPGASISSRRPRSLAVKPSTEGIKRILLKSFGFAVLSTFVDVIMQMISIFSNNPNGSRRLTNMFFDIAAFLNLLFLIFSFVTYKRMLFALCSSADLTLEPSCREFAPSSQQRRRSSGMTTSQGV